MFLAVCQNPKEIEGAISDLMNQNPGWSVLRYGMTDKAFPFAVNVSFDYRIKTISMEVANTDNILKVAQQLQQGARQ